MSNAISTRMGDGERITMSASELKEEICYVARPLRGAVARRLTGAVARRLPLSKRARQDIWLMERIETVHERSKKTYGSPRIHAEIQDQGIPVGRKRVARLMKA